MHRSYQPLAPAQNIFLQRRWDQGYFEIHRKKVLAGLYVRSTAKVIYGREKLRKKEKPAKPLIDNKPPKTYMHVHIKLKKLQLEGERIAIVERDNRILLEKMAHIMRTRGRVDHIKHDYTQKSLNKAKHHRELLRITHENFAILERLTSKAPCCTRDRWLEDWKKNQEYLANISKYPHNWKAVKNPCQNRGLQAFPNKLLHKKVQKNVNHSPVNGLPRAKVA